MEGLHKIVKMKGGFLALNDAAKTKLRRQAAAPLMLVFKAN